MNVQNFIVGNAAQNPTGMQLLGSAVITSANTMTISGIPARTYLRIVLCLTGKGGAGTTLGFRFNADAAGNYSIRQSANGGADSTAINQTSALMGAISGTVAQVIVVDVANINGVHKQMTFQTSGETASPATAPNRTEGAAYWDGTAQVSSVTCFSTDTSNFGATMLVYGSN